MKMKERAIKEERPIKKSAFSNGMRVLLKEDHHSPLVSIQAYFLGGVLLETDKNNGVSQLLARMMLRNSKHYTPYRNYEIVEAGGGSLFAFSGKNTLLIKCESLSSEIERNLEIISEIIKNPFLDDKELDIQKKISINALKREEDSWEKKICNFFRQIFFQKSPYRLNPLGSEESLSEMTITDVIEFFRKYVIPSNLVMSVFGDIDTETIQKVVQGYFADFASDHEFQYPFITIEDPLLSSERQTRIHENNIAFINIGFSGIRISNIRDRYPLQVLEGILSGVNYPGGRIHKELREKKLVYSVKSINSMNVEPGSFEIIAATRPEMTEDVIDVILDNVEKLKKNFVAEEDLDKGKANAKMAYLVEMQKLSYRAADAALYELYGIDYNFPQTYPLHINEVTREEVYRIANTYFANHKIAIMRPSCR